MARSGSDADARDQLAEAFRGYLTRERGLVQGTVGNYSHGAVLFLARLPDPLDEALREMSAGRVLEIIGELVRPGGPSARSLSVPLRALLRFLHVTGRIPRPLAGAVPTEPRWRLASLPARMDGSAVSALLAGCDRGSERGRRDYAVLVLLSRLGLRAAETAGLTLDDVDWRGGTLLIGGKGGRADRLPLPRDAGEAMAAYLQARPRDLPGRAVFWTVRSPRQPLSRQGVADVVRRACAAAGMKPAGPHRLRHALAGELLAAGAALGEVAQMLRHQDLRTTAIYAKVDRGGAGAAGPPGAGNGGHVMSAMQHAAQDYLALRRSLGYRLEAPGRLVGDFARYLDGPGLAHVTVDAALSWATSPGGSPYWHWFRLSAVRGLAGYLHAFDDRHQVPPADLLARRYQRPVPFLFTSADIAALMKAASERPARLHALNCQTLIGLLAVTGMRPGEAYALDREHVDLAAGRLAVINGKYGKSRELALHPSSVIALQEYAAHRDYLCPRPAAPGFFVSLSGDRLHPSNTDTAFRRLAGRAGLQPRSARSTPSLKSLGIQSRVQLANQLHKERSS